MCPKIILRFLPLLIVVLFAHTSHCQNLPVNPKTGLISLTDSLDLSNNSKKEIDKMISAWDTYIRQNEMVEKVFGLDHKTESITARLNFNFSEEIEKGKYITKGEIYYRKNTKTPVFGGTSSSYSDRTEYNTLYSMEGKWLKYEITNFEYFGDGIQGRFEDKMFAKSKTSFSVFNSIGNKKFWNERRESYIEKVRILNISFKDFISKYLKDLNSDIETQDSKLRSDVNYDSYEKIKTGMSYDQIKDLLKSEGRELSSNSSASGNKTINQRVVRWYPSEKDKTKYIRVVFINEKVSSKSQFNL